MQCGKQLPLKLFSKFNQNNWRYNMKKWLLLAALCFSIPAHAQSTEAACQAKAVSKEGKPLAGAAKNSFMKK